jgi:hypothetical protein
LPVWPPRDPIARRTAATMAPVLVEAFGMQITRDAGASGHVVDAVASVVHHDPGGGVRVQRVWMSDSGAESWTGLAAIFAWSVATRRPVATGGHAQFRPAAESTPTPRYQGES